MSPTRREYCPKCRGMVTAEETGADDAYECPKCHSLTRDPRNDAERKSRPAWDVKTPVTKSTPARDATGKVNYLALANGDAHLAGLAQYAAPTATSTMRPSSAPCATCASCIRTRRCGNEDVLG